MELLHNSTVRTIAIKLNIVFHDFFRRGRTIGKVMGGGSVGRKSIHAREDGSKQNCAKTK